MDKTDVSVPDSLKAFIPEDGNLYEGCVEALSSLQTNAKVLQQQKKSGGIDLAHALPHMFVFLRRCGITDSDLERLNIIHVAGSKGKGSTAAMVESILRAGGVKTGLFTSPHLVEVRERVRINGTPVSEEVFVKHFVTCWQRLAAGAEAAEGEERSIGMPAYFRFTTLLALQAFIEEGVEAAVLEVGIGGRYDATNVIPPPTACGLLSIGLEHTSILGHDLVTIANQKAGILKPGCVGYALNQTEEVLHEFHRCAVQQSATLAIAPPLEHYDTAGKRAVQLGLAGRHQRGNASVALQLARHWFSKHRPEMGLPGPKLERSPTRPWTLAQPFEIQNFELDGLRDTEWPGRTQILNHGSLRLYIDGAHTMESCQAAREWLDSAMPRDRPIHVGLIFNCTGDRSPHDLLKAFANLAFLPNVQHMTCVFCPNVSSRKGQSSHHVNKNVSAESAAMQPLACKHAFLALVHEEISNRILGKEWKHEQLPCSTHVAASVEEAFELLQGIKSASPARSKDVTTRVEPSAHVVVTGSLHLVGAVLGYLQSATAPERSS